MLKWSLQQLDWDVIPSCWLWACWIWTSLDSSAWISRGLSQRCKNKRGPQHRKKGGRQSVLGRTMAGQVLSLDNLSITWVRILLLSSNHFTRALSKYLDSFNLMFSASKSCIYPARSRLFIGWPCSSPSSELRCFLFDLGAERRTVGSRYRGLGHVAVEKGFVRVMGSMSLDCQSVYDAYALCV